MAALFVVGSLKRDLFELRYFSGAVPAMLLLAARVVTATTVRRPPRWPSPRCVLTAVMVVGLVDQQLNGANPRLYDFKGAFDRHRAPTPSQGDIVLYEPVYLAEVVEYYGPDLDGPARGTPVPDGAGVWVRRHRAGAQRRGHGGPARHRARRPRAASAHVVDSFERPNVRVWELR